ncbi:MAG TPA: UDP-glucose/GDP-mannose dehydrogenase family protein [Acidimicrobiales bacterium]|nr:UDP-glucose/GDP-mannose dehydrogenase family protein [Acidimicrobiales bacterium]
MTTARTSGGAVPRRGRRVAVVGVGYVGLPTAATLARLGHTVVCGDRDAERIAGLQRGEVPILEAGLEELVQDGLQSGRLNFVVGAATAARSAEFVFLCVPTPERADGSADLSYVEAVAEEISPHLAPGVIVVNKSTVPVGSTTVVERVLGRSDVTVVSNPEFLREGTAVQDSLHPDRLVVGADDADAAAEVGELFGGTGAPLIVTDATTAETIKYASNAFLATKLSFVNAIARLCEALGADVRDLLLGLGYDRRIGFDYLRPGPGWGGSCLPKDTAALLHIAESAGYDFQLLRGVINGNDEQVDSVVDKVVGLVGGSADGRTIGVWGLTFKANTDDRRSSPAVDVAQRLAGLGSVVQAYDPTVAPSAVRGSALAYQPAAAEGTPADLVGLTLCADAYEACRGAAALVVLTEWDEFRWVDFDKARDLMAQPIVIDARNLFDPAAMRRAGFTYRGVGRR